MAINLHEKYAKKIQTAFTTHSLVAGRLSTEYSFSGVKTVKVSTPLTVPMVDYTRTGANRYGEPTEMQDVVQEMTLTQDKSFALTIDKGNNQDQQGIKAAGKMLALQIKERAIPTMDKYVFGALAQKAGQIVGNSTALSKTTVVERIAAAVDYMDDNEVPQESRTLFVPAKVYGFIRLSPEWIGTDGLSKEALARGSVGMFMNMEVVKVPSSRWPAYVNFMVVYKNSATAPVKLNDTKLHQDPPGISGNLLEGRQYYDCFVFGAKADGVYVEVDTGSSKGKVLGALTIAASGGAITGNSGNTVKYTTDGSDPRYSMTAVVGTAPSVSAGDVVKAYQYSATEGTYPSGVTEQKITD